MPFALADYNAGRANVLKWEHGNAATNSAVFLSQIGFPGTKSYVRGVMLRFDHYRPIFPQKAALTGAAVKSSTAILFWVRPQN